MPDVGATTFRIMAQFSQLRRESRGAARDLTQVATAAQAVDRGVRGASRGSLAATERLNSIGKSAQTLGRNMSLWVSAPIVGAFGIAAKAAVDFDQAMTTSLSVLGDVSEETRTKMEDTAKEVASQTTQSAESAAASYFNLASAGLDAEESMAALPQVAAFAQAGLFDMGTAASFALDATAALGLKTDDTSQFIENMTRVTDVLTTANKNANGTIEEFATSLTRKAAQAMKTYGIEVEDGVSLLAAWADQGLKGERAGNAYASMLRDLSRAQTKNADAFEKHGISIFDTEGNLKSMADIAREFTGALEGMSTEQKVAILNQLKLTDQAQQGIFAMLGLGDAIEEYEGQLQGAAGATQDLAEEQMQSLANRFEEAKETMIGVAITIGEDVAPMLLGLAEWIADAVAWFGKLPTSVRRTTLVLLALLAAVGPLIFILGSLARSVAAIQTAMATLRTVRAASTMTELGRAAGGLRGTLGGLRGFLLGPWGLAIGVVVGGLLAWKSHIDKVEEAVVTLSDTAEKLSDVEVSIDGKVNLEASQVRDEIRTLAELGTGGQEAFLVNMAIRLREEGRPLKEAVAIANEIAALHGTEVRITVDMVMDPEVQMEAAAREAQRALSEGVSVLSPFGLGSDAGLLVGQGFGDSLIKSLEQGNVAEAGRRYAAFMDELAQEGSRESLAIMADLVRHLGQELGLGNVQLGEFSSGMDSLGKFAALAAQQGFPELTKQFVEAAGGLNNLSAEQQAAILLADEATFQLLAEADAADKAGDAAGGAVNPISDLVSEEEALAQATQEAVDAMTLQIEQARTQVDPLFALLKATENVTSAKQDLTAAIDEFGIKSPEAAAAAGDVAMAVLDQQDAALKADQAVGDLNQVLADMVVAGELTEDQAKAMGAAMRGAKDDADRIVAGSPYSADLDVNTRAAQLRLDSMEEELKRFTGIDWTVTIDQQWGRVVSKPGGGGRIVEGSGGTSSPAPSTGGTHHHPGEQMHSGGGVGFNPSKEMLKLLERGEGVMSTQAMNNVQAVLDGSGGSGQPVPMPVERGPGLNVEHLHWQNPTEREPEEAIPDVQRRLTFLGGS